MELVLREPGLSYDLILAADTIVYFGDLGRIFRSVKKRLVNGAYFIFAVEIMDGSGWQQTLQHRFKHSEQYLRQEAGSTGLIFTDRMECIIRYESDVPVAGLTVALKNGG